MSSGSASSYIKSIVSRTHFVDVILTTVFDKRCRIQKGLKTINRMDLSDAFSEAFREDLPFPENHRMYID